MVTYFFGDGDREIILIEIITKRDDEIILIVIRFTKSVL